MEDQFSSVQTDGEEYPTVGIQMRAVYRRDAVQPIQ
jgi:hypothetical protein